MCIAVGTGVSACAWGSFAHFGHGLGDQVADSVARFGGVFVVCPVDNEKGMLKYRNPVP